MYTSSAPKIVTLPWTWSWTSLY